MPNHYSNDGCTYVDANGVPIAEPDPPEYPAEWNSEQRLNAYWYAHGRQIPVNSTAAWHGILNAAEHESERRHNKITTLIKTPDDEVPF